MNADSPGTPEPLPKSDAVDALPGAGSVSGAESAAAPPRHVDDDAGVAGAAPSGSEAPGGTVSADAAPPDDEVDPFAADEGVPQEGRSTADDPPWHAADALLREHFGSAGGWQDDIIEAMPMPGAVPADEKGAFDAHLASLPMRRLLLIRHAPTAAAEARATGILRAVVSALLQREPQRRAVSSKFDRPFAPQRLSHAPHWHAGQRHSVIYLFRSDDPESLAFFSRQIEPVRHLWRTLIANDSYLVLTVAMPDAMPLREEGLLREEIGVWHLRDAHVAAPRDAPVVVTDRFEAIVTALAALFPGLAFREYTELVERLSPPLREWVREEGSPRSRHERWYAGERDAVRAELCVALCAPHRLPDVATDDAGAEPGMFLDTPERRAGMPQWLYERQLSVLDDIAGQLADAYFSPTVSSRFCLGYRRLLLRLDALGVRRLESSRVLATLVGALGTRELFRCLMRAGELLAEAGDAAGSRAATVYMNAFVPLLWIGESRLIDALRVCGALERLAGQGSAPFAAVFWAKVRAQAEAQSAYGAARDDAFHVIMYLLAQDQRTSAETIEALLDAVQRSNDAHLDWVKAAGLASRRRKPPVSAARMAMRDVLKALLRNGSRRWLEHAEAVVRLCRSVEPPGGRWLARDFVDALARQGDLLADATTPVLYDALLGAESRVRFAAVLAGLFEVTAPRDGTTDGNEIDMRIVVSIYRSLVLGLMRHEPASPVPLVDRAAALSHPWLQTQKPSLRNDLMPAARVQLLALQNERRRQRGDAAALRRADESVIALQSLMRCWQEAARGAGRAHFVST